MSPLGGQTESVLLILPVQLIVIVGAALMERIVINIGFDLGVVPKDEAR